jgi:hypothetical protein
MVASHKSLLLVAHPGHELLIHGWLTRSRPRVCALTDGSGNTARSRVDESAAVLDAVKATRGSIFGRHTDREMYAAILAADVELIEGLVNEIAGEITANGIDTVVSDAMEGFNPVHDLCRLIAGAACSRVGEVAHYEYPLHDGPHAFDAVTDAHITDLDDAALDAKLACARELAPALGDIGEMLARFGEAAFRREAFLPIRDWSACPWPAGMRPLYERIGEERVALRRYDRVIRYAEHMRPLAEHVRATMTTSCAF